MPKEESIPQSARQNRSAYSEANHKQLGSLHERMKWLVGCKEELREYTELNKNQDTDLSILIQNLSVAVMDLETEVAYTNSIIPPFSRRGQTREELLALPPFHHTKNPKRTK